MSGRNKDGSPRYNVVIGGKVSGGHDDHDIAKSTAQAQKRNNPNTHVSILDNETGGSEPIDR